MIDIHAHILHDLDDGPATLEESLEMCRIAQRDGIRTIVATPHTLNGLYNPDWETIFSRVHDLNEALKGVSGGRSSASVLRPQSELNPPPPPLEILPGADVHFSPEILNLHGNRIIRTVNDKGRHIMIEFPHHEIPANAEDLLFRLLTKRITPIISHPERNGEIAQNPKRYYQMVRMGCLGQVTAMSLANGFGSAIRRSAERLLSHRLVHFIASDAHSIDGRRPVLSSAVREAAKILGEAEAIKMVTEYPREILEGRTPKVCEPIPIK